MSRIQRRSISRAFDSWYALLCQRRRLRSFGAVMLHRQKAMSLRSWMDFVDSRAHQRSMMTRMLSRWVSDKLRKGWNAWQSFVLWRDASLERKRAQEARLRMVVQRIRLRGVSRAYLAWHEHVIQRKRLQRHVRHMLHRSKAAALSAWVDWVDTRQSLRRRMQLTLRKWTNENLRKGMQTWKNYILVVEAETERERVRSARLNNVICRIQNRYTSRAMIAWTITVSERKRIRRFLRHMKNRHLASAYQAWIFHVETRHKAQE